MVEALDVIDPRFILNIDTNITRNQFFSNLIAIGVLVVLLALIMALLFGQDAGGGGATGYETTGYSSYAARSLGPAYSAINVLYMLEEAFSKLEVAEFECQQRLVCEAHQAGAPAKYGRVANKLQKIVGSADLKSVKEMDEAAAAVFQSFRDAAVRGIQQEDCEQLYQAKCPKGLRDYIREKF